tara:strand:+ start:209 stop:388 length:180 start_codon:yes stop_codon:yes gene_type:complete
MFVLMRFNAVSGGLCGSVRWWGGSWVNALIMLDFAMCGSKVMRQMCQTYGHVWNTYIKI